MTIKKYCQSNPPLFVVQGSYHEMGRDIGSATQDLIASSLSHYMARFEDDAGLTRAEIEHWGSRYWEATCKYDEDIAAMLEGMAETSRQPVRLLAALNARTELLFGAKQRDDGCTALSVLPQFTKSGHTLLAQNWDWHPDQAPNTILLATRDTQGFSVLAMTEAGMLAKCGLNSSGLGMCLNLLTSDSDCRGEGVPIHLMLRGALQARTMACAHRNVLQPERVASANVLLADSGGESIDFELAPSCFASILPRSGLIAHANHFETDLGITDLKAKVSALTLLRPTRVRHLLEPWLERREVSEEAVVSVLRDTYSYPDGICRHRNEEESSGDQVSTVFSVMMDLTSQDLWIAPGPPDQHAYTRWNLDSLFESPTPTPDFPPVTEEG
ncbi:C45 family autoproteolytic acyltransferase/hydolase [Brevibacterium zhoupengii]|uniref:C45 family autoproteolytic acyltransferase/hydolase n=1 Tax=Brevibacterium zhoupengii TaxID=2898795 RepID=UPI0021D4868A|nr:C45 family peptidase [Brevibacterium zhoupengii]